jgi:hypothetical protein
LSVGVEVPIPTQSEETARYAVAVPSVHTPAPPPTSSVPQVSIPFTVSSAVQVVKEPSEKPRADPEAPAIFAVSVTVSVVASPRVVLPLTLNVPVVVTLPVVPASTIENKVFVPSLKVKVPESAIPTLVVVSLKYRF